MISSKEILELMYQFKFDNLNISNLNRNKINQLKKYMYSETMPNIFTKKIFENLIASNSINNGTLIYLDFNRIGANNAIYGKEEVTKVMIRSIDAVISILPKETIPIRMGGDEFIFIIPEQKIGKNILQRINSLVENYSKTIKIKEGISATSVLGFFDETHTLYDTYFILSQDCAKNKKRPITKILEILRAFNFSNSDTIIYCLLSVLEAAKKWNSTKDSVIIDKELEEILNSITTNKNKKQIDAIRHIIITIKERILKEQNLKEFNNFSLATSIKPSILPKIQSSEELIENLKKFIISSWGLPKIGPFLDEFETSIPESVRRNHNYKVITIEITHLKASNIKYGILKTDQHLQEIINLIMKEFGSNSYFASLKGGKILVLTNEKTEKINSIAEKIQKKYLPFGLESNVYLMPKNGWNKSNLLKIKNILENNGSSQIKSLDITDPSIQAIIVDFFAKYIETLLNNNYIEEKRTSKIITDMNKLYLTIINLFSTNSKNMYK